MPTIYFYLGFQLIPNLAQRYKKMLKSKKYFLTKRLFFLTLRT